MHDAVVPPRVPRPEQLVEARQEGRLRLIGKQRVSPDARDLLWFRTFRLAVPRARGRTAEAAALSEKGQPVGVFHYRRQANRQPERIADRDPDARFNLPVFRDHGLHRGGQIGHVRLGRGDPGRKRRKLWSHRLPTPITRKSGFPLTQATNHGTG